MVHFVKSNTWVISSRIGTTHLFFLILFIAMLFWGNSFPSYFDHLFLLLTGFFPIITIHIFYQHTAMWRHKLSGRDLIIVFTFYTNISKVHWTTLSYKLKLSIFELLNVPCLFAENEMFISLPIFFLCLVSDYSHISKGNKEQQHVLRHDLIDYVIPLALGKEHCLCKDNRKLDI